MRQPRSRGWPWGTAIVLIIFVIALALGYGLTGLVYRWTGSPSELLAHVFSGITGVLLLAVALKMHMAIHLRRGHRGKSFGDLRMKMVDDIINALNRIANGDFSVLVPVNEYAPYPELVESINKMAQELGSMENLRQDFISNVSHEIQSPLTSISGFAALLKKDTLTAEQRAHYLDIIEMESKRLSKLSDNLLKLSTLESKTQSLTYTSYQLNKQIENAVLSLEPQWIAKNLNLEFELEKVIFTGDEGLLSQVWINLLHNAIKFTPNNGNINVTLSSDGSNIVCRISDTGTGISSEDQMRIFERFYKADKARDRAAGGNGLGLSLVKKIVELHGGRVTVESEVGKGAVFCVCLPVAIKK